MGNTKTKPTARTMLKASQKDIDRFRKNKAKYHHITYIETEGRFKFNKMIDGKTIQKRSYSLDEIVKIRDKKLNSKDEYTNKTTFGELFPEFIDKIINQHRVKPVTVRQYESLYRDYFQGIANKRIVELRKPDYQRVYNQSGDKSKSFAIKMKAILTGVCKIAYEQELINRKYADDIEDVAHKDKQRNDENKPLAKDDLVKLSNMEDCEDKDILIMLLYNGWRSNELLKLTSKNIDLERKVFVDVGSKTKASKHRTVPIHDTMLPLVTKYYNNPLGSNGHLFHGVTELVDTDTIDRECNKAISRLNNYCLKVWGCLPEDQDKPVRKQRPLHTPHHLRHTFSTNMERENVQGCIIDRLGGWSSKGNIRQKTYTHTWDIEIDLRPSLNKLHYPELEQTFKAK